MQVKMFSISDRNSAENNAEEINAWLTENSNIEIIDTHLSARWYMVEYTIKNNDNDDKDNCDKDGDKGCCHKKNGKRHKKCKNEE